MSNSLDPDQARRFIEPDQGPNCLQGNQPTLQVDKGLRDVSCAVVREEKPELAL